MANSKADLRQRLKKERLELSASQVKSLSQNMTSQLLDIVDWTKISSLHIYLPIKQQREADTNLLLGVIRRRYPQVKTAAWKQQSAIYKSFWFDDAGFQKTVPENYQFDLIIVPLLGFDKDGHRIGYGGGFYDEYLKTQKRALTIGLCYEFGRQTTSFGEAHDIPLKMIITENLTYRF
ncbi:5-formyltetrahydrofolate cyclo-ligase [Candidatus Saccharibacteria bacterium]|nr:5-formyltetrahydrofolate cyclo-ligase [Candidatus Saccharibacteria bacterium]